MIGSNSSNTKASIWKQEAAVTISYSGATEKIRGTEIIRRHLAERLNLNPDICVLREQRLRNINRIRRNRWGQAYIQPRPIIVNFRDSQDVELILENANRLKGTSFEINKDHQC